MNWDNQDNKDPWGNRSNGNDQDFDDLLKRFSSILGGKSGGGKVPHQVADLIFHQVDFLVMDFLYLQLCIYLHPSIQFSLGKG